MNEQLQGAVAQILERAISGIDSSVDFMQAELPDVIERLLLWYAVKSVAISIFGLILLLAYVIAISLAYKSRPADGGENLFWERWSHKSNNEFNFDWTLVFGVGCVFVLIPSIIMITSIMTAIQIWIAPKIWLMEYAAKLVG